MTPIFEPGFSERRYGFRPGRSAHEAVAAATGYAERGRDWVVEIDIAKLFKVSTATSNFMIGVGAAASAGVYFTRGYVDPALAMPVMLGVLAGAVLAARSLAEAWLDRRARRSVDWKAAAERRPPLRRDRPGHRHLVPGLFPRHHPDDRVLRGEPSEFRSVSGILKGLDPLHCRSYIQFGPLLLIATPGARVAISVFVFFAERDHTCVVVSLIVLAVPIFSWSGDTGLG